MTMQERVARGANLLDERGPADWWRGIDLTELDLARNSRCVLGQLYNQGQRRSKYIAGLASLELEHDGFTESATQDGAFAHGFTQTLRDCHRKDYAHLTDEWRALIARRRLAEMPPDKAKELVTA